MAHQFIRRSSFLPPGTKCAKCKKFIWGLSAHSQNAVQCSACNLVLHDTCSQHLSGDDTCMVTKLEQEINIRVARPLERGPSRFSPKRISKIVQEPNEKLFWCDCGFETTKYTKAVGHFTVEHFPKCVVCFCGYAPNPSDVNRCEFCIFSTTISGT
jgi:hypothetical protein